MVFFVKLKIIQKEQIKKETFELIVRNLYYIAIDAFED